MTAYPFTFRPYYPGHTTVSVGIGREGVGIFDRKGRLYLKRCPKCIRENHISAQLSGQCAWCGCEPIVDADTHAEALRKFEQAGAFQ